MNTIPSELILVITGYLPGAQQFRCRAVCKRWRRILPVIPRPPPPVSYAPRSELTVTAVSYRRDAFCCWAASHPDEDVDEQFLADDAAEYVEITAREDGGIKNIYKQANITRRGRRAELMYRHCGIRSRRTLHGYFK